MSFERHVYSVQRYVEFTQAKYACLFKPDVATYPICCFGDPTNATVITVGVNPSVGEFEGGRWPDTAMTHLALAGRSTAYFTAGGGVSPHMFFEPWKQALACLEVSYESGHAVHVDLSPRATRHIRRLAPGFENDLFLEMVQRDLWTFFATIALCRKAKLIVMAGTVTGRYYINEFLQRFAPDYGYAVGGAFDRHKHPGRGKVCWHQLEGTNSTLPVFFCSSSPAAEDRNLLPSRVCERATEIRELLNE